MNPARLRHDPEAVGTVAGTRRFDRCARLPLHALAPVVTTPLLPETVIPGPPPDPLAAGPATIPMTVKANAPKPLILPPGAQLPQPGDLGPSLPGSRIADLAPERRFI